MAETVTLINLFEVPVGEEAAFISGWEKTAEFMRKQRGYVSTALHQSLAPNATYRFINIARWESPEAFQKAVSSPDFPGSAIRQKAHPALFRVVRE